MHPTIRLVMIFSVLSACGAEEGLAQTGSAHGDISTNGAFAPDGPFGQTVASVQALALAGKDVVYAGSFGNGLFRSGDRGQNWAQAGEGIADPFILSLAIGRDGAVYVGTFRGGVFRSKDEGKTWQALNDGFKRLEIKSLLVAGDTVFAGTSDGVYRLNASGDHWSIVTPGLTDILVHALVRSADGTLYAGTSGKGVLRFKQDTTGWVRMRHGLKDHEGMTENFIRVLVIDREQALYAGTFDGGVFRSADGGETWRPISRALPNDSIRGIVLIENGLIVATGYGIFKTVDKGRQWTPLNKGLTTLAIQAMVAGADGTLYAGTGAGVFRSEDGQSWAPVNQGMGVGMAPPPFIFK